MNIQTYFKSRESFSIEIISKIIETHTSILLSQIDDLHRKKTKIEYWQLPIESLYFKISLHLSSLNKLLSKTEIPFDGKYLQIHDISSINIIVRAIIENYLTIYHIYYDTIDDSQKEFRYLIYMRSGLIHRQSFPATAEENIKKRDEEKIEIDKINERIKTLAYFKSLPQKKQTTILKSKDAKETSWSNLLEESDLKPQMFKTMWQVQSNFAHSESLSTLQLRSFAGDLDGLHKTSLLMAEMANMIAATAIRNLYNLFPEAMSSVDSLPDDDRNLLNFFVRLATKDGT